MFIGIVPIHGGACENTYCFHFFHFLSRIFVFAWHYWTFIPRTWVYIHLQSLVFPYDVTYRFSECSVLCGFMCWYYTKRHMISHVERSESDCWKEKNINKYYFFAVHNFCLNRRLSSLFNWNVSFSRQTCFHKICDWPFFNNKFPASQII
jgi:hypothetical protein